MFLVVNPRDGIERKEKQNILRSKTRKFTTEESLSFDQPTQSRLIKECNIYIYIYIYIYV